MAEQTVSCPEYMLDFRCVGGSCEDNCCIGWDVDFDKASYNRYKQYTETDLKTIFQRAVFIKKDAYDASVDFAAVKLSKDKHCAFLHADGLCRIQTFKGEKALSRVCRTYPRTLNSIDGNLELSAALSCPEAARLALSRPGALRLTQQSMDVEGLIVTHTLMRGQSPKAQKQIQRRIEVLEILEKPFDSAEDRLREVGKSRGLKRSQASSIKGPDQSEKANALLTALMAMMLVLQSDQPPRYGQYREAVAKGLGFKRSKGSGYTSVQLYAHSTELQWQKLIEGRAYLADNYMINYLFRSFFPFSEGYQDEQLFSLCVGTFWLLKLHMIGFWLTQNDVTTEALISLISAYAKTIEHHYTLMDAIVNCFEGFEMTGMDLLNLP